MDAKDNHKVVKAIIEKQDQVTDCISSMRTHFFWSNELELFSSQELDDVPSSAWQELPQYPNVEKWADKLFERATPTLPQTIDHQRPLEALVSAVVVVTNDSQKIMMRAEHLATLEWQLKHITYWTGLTHQPNKNRKKTFGELTRQRELLRDSAVEAICFYQCGACEFLNDFERYNSDSITDIYMAEQFKAAFHKMMVFSIAYHNLYCLSESKAENRKGKTGKNRSLELWLAERLKISELCTADSLWKSISRDSFSATKTPDMEEMYVEADSNDVERLYVDGLSRKPITLSTFRTYFTEAKNKRNLSS